MWIVMLRLLQGASAVGTVVVPPPVGLPDMSIQNFYVIDFKSKRRRPLTEQEWQQVRQWAKIYKRVKVRYIKDMTANRDLEQKAEAMLRGERRRKREDRVKLKAAVDPSGLMPKKRRRA